jgi:hypothetical protein
MSFDLLPPARYFPMQKGIYEVAPGLASFGTSFGNGERESHVFQFDREFGRYRENKLRCRAERLDKYFVTRDFKPDVASRVARFIIERLLVESPAIFRWEDDASGGGTLFCALTGDTLRFNAARELTGFDSLEPIEPAYASAYDALISQVQEDFAVVTRGTPSSPGKDWLAALHLCSPSHWAAEDKIGRDFFSIHEPIAEVEKLNRAAGAIIDAMIRKGPYVRFVWGFGTDDRLNHHPVPPSGADQTEWRGRSWAPQRVAAGKSPFILRVERQITWGLPEVESAIFAIRVSFIDGGELKADPKERSLLRSSLLSMTEKSRGYKGLDCCMDEVIGWLDA